MERLKKLLLMFIIALPFSAVNASSYIKGGTPSPFQATISIIFLLSWLSFGFFIRSKQKEFFIQATIFWLGGSLILFLGYHWNISVLFFPTSLVLAGPVYGIKYFFGVPSNINFALICSMLGYGCSIVGVILGGFKKHRTQDTSC